MKRGERDDDDDDEGSGDEGGIRILNS